MKKGKFEMNKTLHFIPKELTRVDWAKAGTHKASCSFIVKNISAIAAIYSTCTVWNQINTALSAANAAAASLYNCVWATFITSSAGHWNISAYCHWARILARVKGLCLRHSRGF